MISAPEQIAIQIVSTAVIMGAAWGSLNSKLSTTAEDVAIIKGLLGLKNGNTADKPPFPRRSELEALEQRFEDMREICPACNSKEEK